MTKDHTRRTSSTYVRLFFSQTNEVNEKKEKKMSIDIYMNGVVSFFLIIWVLSMNETLSLLWIELMKMNNKRIKCLLSTRSRLQNHFTVVTMIQMYFVIFNISFICGFMILFVISTRFRSICHLIQSNIHLVSCSPFRRYT